jgi:hypothetical protein
MSRFIEGGRKKDLPKSNSLTAVFQALMEKKFLLQGGHPELW